MDQEGTRRVGLNKTDPHSNVDEFRVPALHFEEFGTYTNYPVNGHPGSLYHKFWEEEARRCVYGYNIGRDEIPGYFYWYLNYCPIYIAESKSGTEVVGLEALMEREQADRILAFPSFWDGDYDYYHYLDEAEKEGEHGSVIKTRGRGFSFKGGSMCNRNYYLIPGSKSYCMADDKEYLVEDGILTKAWDMMDHIESYTPWGKRRQRHDSIMHKRASYYMEKGGLRIEKGFKSEIIGVTLKNNWNKARGKRGKLILFEESGKNPHLLKAWNIALKSMQQGRLTFGLMVAFGTGGTEDVDFMGLEQLFYEGGGHNVHMIPNKWDTNIGDGKCGYFSSVLQNLEGTMDEDGNSDQELAEKMTDLERDNIRKETKNMEAIIRHIAEEPKTPEEAVMRIGGTIFPINDLKQQLAELRAYPEKYEETEWVGKLNVDIETKKVKWEIDPDAKAIRKFPMQDKRFIDGAIVIYEHPVLDSDGNVPYGIYIASNDPYDHDESTTDSLGSTFIMNRITERIVAEYTGRPQTAKMYYENVRRLLLYYNARCNYENNLKGLHTYMEFKNCTYLLCDTPAVVHDKVFDKSLLNRKKGTPGTDPINKWGRELILTWLLTPVEPESEVLNLHKIRSVPLLQELIYWHKEGNFDRVSSLGMLMILKDDMAKWIPEMENKKETVSSFFLRQPMFQEKFREQNDPFEKIQRMRKLRRS
jgi:hypothetical protein